MAEQRRDISYLTESKDSGIACKDDEYDLSVIDVIERNSKKIGNDKYVKVSKNVVATSSASVRTEVILLDEAPAANVNKNIVKTCENRRVIELSDSISKMELRRQFKVDVASQENSGGGQSRRNTQEGDNNDDDDDDTSAKILSRLPPGTILIKQNTNNNATTKTCAPEDSDYVHDSSKDCTETNSSGSSSANSYNDTTKVKRMQHRSVRTKKTVEVRRNPVRNKKKKPIDEDFPRPRQRLLSVNKRKSSFVVDPIPRKRVKAAAVPYMNTRSVTRKMYTVGATYQAPTIRDATKWKEWPSHGMHERPVWHPQFGLAYEYNDRHFLSLDDRTYREIIDESVIEVVSVDPHPERVMFASNKRKFDRLTSKNSADPRNLSDSNDNSFEACMHGSLHSVLAYCAQVSAPMYRNTVDMKLKRINQSSDVSYEKSAMKLSPEACKREKKVDQRSLPNETTSAKISAQSQSAFSNSSEVPKCLVVPRRTISFTNVRNMQGNILQEVFGRASKNTLIFLKPTDPPIKPEKNSTTTKASSTVQSNAISTKANVNSIADEINLAKLDDSAISDETLMEISSMYNKILPNEEIETAAKNTNETASTAFVATKNLKHLPYNEESTSSGIRTSHSLGRSQNLLSSKNVDTRFTNSNQAAEIAKILAEYNQKAAKNTNARTMTSHKSIKSEKDSDQSRSNRTTFLSVVEQPKKIKKDDEDDGKKMYRGSDAHLKREINVNIPIAVDKLNISLKTEGTGKNPESNSKAIDLSSAKLRESETEKKSENKLQNPMMNRQWLQELIEDTALLYCAAAGVRQDDVVNYLDSLDSTQSIEWLGS